ncbi:MFS transporter [Streptomyces spectabilis]|uniref:MFS family permease n=1 Tax=Streptomyces spectabilis TaxID=68270 RepID=A0A7W8AZ63_STRST|nr:MFS transporter [Streptomyces spectabilis]MBB5107253.1 MFS family permease [Streptomyces spectabilis]MCI3899953.1 MFS transporter [Streptomyces spectabilis]
MLVVVLVAELMNALDGSVVYTALPSIQHDTGASGAAVQWIHAAYALTFALGLITGGQLGDLYGRKRLFLLGTGVFTAASLVCGLAGTPALLIPARVVQGGAAAVMVPQVLATLHVSFDEGSRAKAFSLYGTIMSLGSVAGPVLGGVLTSADVFGLGWRPIFLINVPIGVATVLLGLRYLPESRDLAARRLDLTGTVLAGLGLLLVAYPLTVGGAHQWPAWSFVMMAGGTLILTVFVVQQRARTVRGRDPLVVMALFKSRSFTAGLSAQLVFGLLSGVFFLAWTLFLQDGLGFSPRQAATGFVAASVGEMAGAWLAMSLAVRHGRRGSAHAAGRPRPRHDRSSLGRHDTAPGRPRPRRVRVRALQHLDPARHRAGHGIDRRGVLRALPGRQPWHHRHRRVHRNPPVRHRRAAGDVGPHALAAQAPRHA